MAISSAQVSVGTTATSVLAAGVGGGRVRVRNAGAASVFLGASGVTTAAGYELTTGSTVDLVLEANETLYGIVATGTQTVHVLSA